MASSPFSSAPSSSSPTSSTGISLSPARKFTPTPLPALSITRGTAIFYFYILFLPLLVLFVFLVLCYCYYRSRRKTQRQDIEKGPSVEVEAEAEPKPDSSSESTSESASESVDKPQEEILIQSELERPKAAATKRGHIRNTSSPVQWRLMDIEELWYPPPGSPGYTPSGIMGGTRMDQVVKAMLGNETAAVKELEDD